MPIVEYGVNYPTVLGRRNIPPPAKVRVTPMGTQPMALIGGETPMFLAQKLLAQLVERPTPILDALRERVRQLRGQVENIPPPYVRPMEWPVERPVGRLPSAVSDIRPTGPQRTAHPKICVEW